MSATFKIPCTSSKLRGSADTINFCGEFIVFFPLYFLYPCDLKLWMSETQAKKNELEKNLEFT